MDDSEFCVEFLVAVPGSRVGEFREVVGGFLDGSDGRGEKCVISQAEVGGNGARLIIGVEHNGCAREVTSRVVFYITMRNSAMD